MKSPLNAEFCAAKGSEIVKTISPLHIVVKAVQQSNKEGRRTNACMLNKYRQSKNEERKSHLLCVSCMKQLGLFFS